MQLEGEFQESVKLERIAKTVTFKSSRTDMEFSRMDGLAGSGFRRTASRPDHRTAHLTTRSKNIRLDSVSGDVRLQDDNGSVELGMRTVGNVQIDNRNGDGQLSLPDKAGFRAGCAHARRRNPVGFSGTEGQQRRSRIPRQRQRGKWASHIVINNEHEGIEIRKASATGRRRPPVPPVPGQAGESFTGTKEEPRANG